MTSNAPSLSELITRIRVTHHVTTRLLLDDMSRAVERVFAATPRRELERLDALRRAFTYFRDDLLAHLLTEERSVFPYMLALEEAALGRGPPPHAAFRSIASPIQVMKNEQQSSERSLARLHAVIVCTRPPTGSPPAWSDLGELVAKIRTDLAVHVDVEQNALFPAAVEVEHELVARRLADAQRRAPTLRMLRRTVGPG